MYREKVLGVKHVPNIAYAMFKKNYETPSKSEGFEEIVQIEFSPDFTNDQEKQVYCEFT
jgi:hypothetical protein